MKKSTNRKIIIIILLSIFFFSCDKKDATINLNKSKSLNDSLTAIIDSLKKPKLEKPDEETIKEKTFKEFAQEFMKGVNESKEYYLLNSESKIQLELFSYYFPIKDKYNVSRSENVSSSKLHKDLKLYFIKKYDKLRNIGKDKISYKMGGDYETVSFLFRKDDKGNWKFYKMTCPEGELEPQI